MVGRLDGKRVLDLAYGFDFYTLLFKQRGTAQAIGVDISPEIVRTRTEGEDDGRRDIRAADAHGYTTDIPHGSRGNGWRCRRFRSNDGCSDDLGPEAKGHCFIASWRLVLGDHRYRSPGDERPRL